MTGEGGRPRLGLDFERVAADGALARGVAARGGGGAGRLPLRLCQRLGRALHLRLLLTRVTSDA